MSPVFDDGLLDDEVTLQRAEPGLRRIAEAGARVRLESVTSAEPLAAAVARLSDSRPRAVVAAGPDSRLLRAVLARIEQEWGSRAGVTLDHLDGLTVLHDDWWFNVRASNTEPLLRLNAEAGDTATLDRLRDDVLAIIRSGS